MSQIYTNTAVPEMIDTDSFNYLHEPPDVEIQTIREIARAILARSIADLRSTVYLGKRKASYATGSHQEHIQLAYEVRQWFLNREDTDIFSFISCCELAGKDFKQVLKEINPFMAFRDPLKRSEFYTDEDVLLAINRHPDGITLTALSKEIAGGNKRYNTIRRIAIGLSRKKLAMTVRKRSRKSIYRDRTFWVLTERGKELAEQRRVIAEQSVKCSEREVCWDIQRPPTEELIPSIQDRHLDRR